ncbi:DUF4843 domain-containing protein [Pedobacter nyackensis]|uniref:DUF4843 domain-containing protein n=1 Tax=Pedobacter nyackensis TaxID=475255 RepID=UPI00292E04BA|nr:DUF4843 domain-containing protein [Pedobacter nyackensis]
MKNYTYLLLLVLAIFGSGCSKDELLSFQEKPKVYIYKKSNDLVKDSTTYSFAIRAVSIVQDTVFVPLRIMGDAAAQDRTVNYQVMSKSTADADSYQLLPAVIKANQFTGYIPVVVKKTAAIKTKEGKLWLSIAASDSFEPGVADQLNYLIKINDFLSRPSSWSDVYLGKYSRVKFELIIKETGYTDFTNVSFREYRFISQLCKNAVLLYQAAHGTMYDEDDDEVIFPF